jgi:hypothetical protein
MNDSTKIALRLLFFAAAYACVLIAALRHTDIVTALGIVAAIRLLMPPR